MKKILLLCSLLACSLGVSYAQNTAVTATVVDSDGTTWANGKWSIAWIPGPSNPNINAYTNNGAKLSNSVAYQSGTLNGSGALSVTVYDNSVTFPTGSGWALSVCSNTSAPCSTYNFATAGGSQDISAALTVNIAAPRFKAVSGTYGYVDTEATLSVSTGATYWNVTSGISRCYSGSAWGICSAGGGGGAWGSITGTLSNQTDLQSALNATKVGSNINSGTVPAANVQYLQNVTSDVQAQIGVLGLPLPANELFEYHFDQTSGTTVNDSSGLVNNATFAGGANAPTWAGGTSLGLNFSGSTVQWISLPSGANAVKTMIIVANLLPSLNHVGFECLLCGTAAQANNEFNFIVTGGLGAMNQPDILNHAGYAGQSSQFINSGIQALTYVAGPASANTIYQNTSPLSGVSGSTTTTPVAGNFQMGAGTSAFVNGASFCYGCTFYYAVGWNTQLTQAQVVQAYQKITHDLAQRNVLINVANTPLASTALGPTNIVCKGDSITLGTANGATPWCTAGAMSALDSNFTYTLSNFGVGGQTLATALQNGQEVDQMFDPTAPTNYLTIWAGTNDLCQGAVGNIATVYQTFKYMREYINTRKRIYPDRKILLATMISRGNFATCDTVVKNPYNSLLRASWKAMGADALVDIAQIALLGADGAYANATYFAAVDLVHPTTTSNLTLIAPAFANAINGLLSTSTSANPTLFTTTGTLAAGDWYSRADTTSAGFTLTLFPCAAQTGTTRDIKNAGTANTLTVAGNGADLIDGAASITLTSGQSARLVNVLNAASTGGCHWEQTQ